jgi:predicted GNAT family acetyltransferase
LHGLPESLFLNPVWHALNGEHKHLSAAAGAACRYQADVSPFAAVGRSGAAAYQDLRSLLVPHDSVWMVDDGQDAAPGFRLDAQLTCLQMVLPAEVTLPGPDIAIESLTEANAAEMAALTDIAFPGFFRARTHLMGSYVGIRINGELAAMGGERLRIDRYPELSAICTHPAHRGKGFATSIIRHLVRNHRREGLVSWLHVGAENRHAVAVYRNIGFNIVRTLTLRRLSRTD